MIGLRMPSWPVWLIGLGTTLVVVGAASALWAIGPGGIRPASLLRPDDLPRAVISLVLAGTLGTLIFAVGVVAYVVRGSVSSTRAKQGYASIGTILACFAVAVLVANLLTVPYGIFALLQHPGQPIQITPGVLVYSIIALDGSLLGVVYFRIVRPGVLTWEQMGLTTASLGDRARLGIVAGVVVIALSAAIEQALDTIGIHQTQTDLFAGVKTASLGQFVGVLLAVAVIAPICEEIFFRGYVFTAMSTTRGLPLAFVSSSVLFAGSHLNAQALLPILAIGLGFGYLFSHTRSLVPSVVAHIVNNAVALTAFYLYG
jgi:membrane protease YdiL (CAAX protease family)